MFVWGCIVGGIIVWCVKESRFKKRALDYWKAPQGSSAMNDKDLAEISSIGRGHIAALRWVQHPSAAYLPFEMMLFEWLHARGKIKELERIDNLAYKSLYWRVVSYSTMLEINSAEGLVNHELRQEIENTSNLEVAIMRWNSSLDDWHVSLQDVIERLGGYQDLGAFIEASDYPEGIKEMIFKIFIKVVENAD